MPRALINELEANQFIEGVYAIQNCQLGQTRNGKPFLKCLIADRTGRSPGRMWNATEQLFEGLPTDGFVSIKGQTQPYQGEMQIIIQDIRAVEPSEDDLKELLPRTEKDIDQMFADVKALLDTIEFPGLKALVEQYLEDEPLMDDFRLAPAAIQIHHAFLGGLLEHTLNLMQAADRLLPLYPGVNRDIVLVGLFLHDMGKCSELSFREGFKYTDDGQLVGHIARGSIWLEAKAEGASMGGAALPEAVIRVLHHIILSHHGIPEFGALKTPATPEAQFISMLDNLDAKMQLVLASAKRDEPITDQDLGGHFTEKVWALDTRVYRPDPTTL